jgi:hypothetical protein
VQERTDWRRADPGPPVRDETRPTPRVARYVDGFPIIARDPGASPLLLDLTAAYTRSFEFEADFTSSEVSGSLGYAFGIARIDGVDYDVRGVVELRQNGEATLARAPGIRVPTTPISAFHVLIYAPLQTPAPEVRDYAYVRLHYQDGSMVRLPIRTQREVPGMTPDNAMTPVGWVRGVFLTQVGSSRQELMSNPRLPNPHPEKLIATIDLEGAGQRFSQPIFFAVTAEPVIAATDSGNDKAGNTETKGHANAASIPSHPR